MDDDHRDVSAQGGCILVISDESIEGAAPREATRSRARNGEGEALVVAPALNSPIAR